MRLQCYTNEWAGYACYGVVMGLLYIAGLPILVSWLLFSRRRNLFGSSAAAQRNRTALGFLYEVRAVWAVTINNVVSS